MSKAWDDGLAFFAFENHGYYAIMCYSMHSYVQSVNERKDNDFHGE